MNSISRSMAESLRGPYPGLPLRSEAERAESLVRPAPAPRSASTPVYLDHNATTAPWPEVTQAMLHALQHQWANPSSTHAAGQAARAALADARRRVADFLGCQPTEVVFTSGATEANHLAVSAALRLAASQTAARGRWLLSAVEHPGLMALARARHDGDAKPDLLPVDAQGRIDLVSAARLIDDRVALVSAMAANNETGVLMPIGELSALAHAHGALLHVDATQIVGKHPFSFAASGADLMSVSAHKLGGPKGVGALVVRKGLALPAVLVGKQERNRRGGTENLPGIVGFAAACDRTAATQAADMARIAELRDRLQAGLQHALPQLQVLGDQVPRLANTLCLRFGDLKADEVLSRLERAGVQASSGSACSAGRNEPSHVLLAMGLNASQAMGGVRLSLGTSTTRQEVEHAIDAASKALRPMLTPPAPAPGVALRDACLQPEANRRSSPSIALNQGKP